MLYLKNSYSQEQSKLLNEGDHCPSLNPQILIPFWQKHIGPSAGSPPKALILHDPTGKLGLLAHLWGYEVIRLQGLDETTIEASFPAQLEQYCFDLILSHETTPYFQRNQYFFLDRLHQGGTVILLGPRSLKKVKFPGKPDMAVNEIQFGYLAGNGLFRKRMKVAMAVDRLIHPWIPPIMGKFVSIAINKLPKIQKTITR